MEDFFKSIKAILYDRVTSPFFGTLVISWLIWNWKIVFVTFFVSEKILRVNKIDYIISISNNNWVLIYFPLISTVVLLTIVPLISYGAYCISLLYEREKVRMKQKIEQKKVLTIEQSFALRTEISILEERFNRLIAEKESEIKNWKTEFGQVSEKYEKSNKFISELKAIRLQMENQLMVDHDKFETLNTKYQKMSQDFQTERMSQNQKDLINQLVSVSEKANRYYRFVLPRNSIDAKVILRGSMHANIRHVEKVNLDQVTIDYLLNHNMISDFNESYRVTPLGRILMEYLYVSQIPPKADYNHFSIKQALGNER